MEKNYAIVKQILQGLLIYFVANLFGGLAFLFDKGMDFMSLANGEIPTPGFINYLFNIIAIAGLVMYYLGLKKYAEELDEIGKDAINKVALGILLAAVSTIVGLIPFLGWIVAAIISIIAFILEFIGFSAFRKSTSLNEQGQAAAQKLYLAILFALIGTCVSVIPLIGVLGSILLILYLIFILMGWSALKNSYNQPQQQQFQQPQQPFQQPQQPVENTQNNESQNNL